MQEQEKAIYDFLFEAYRSGALDGFMRLSRAVADKKYEDQSLVFSELEDAISEMDDLSGVDEVLAKVFEQMPLLTDRETLEGLAVLVSYLTPWLDSMMAAADRDTQVVSEKTDRLKHDLPLAGKAVFTLFVLNSRPLGEALGQRARASGEGMGKALNAFSELVNAMEEKNPGAISEFMSGAFSSLNGDEMTKMLNILSNSFLDQKPPLLKWTASTMGGRARKKLLGK